MTKIIGREIKDAIQGVTQLPEILLYLICFREKCSFMADRQGYIIGRSKSAWLFWSQKSHIDLHYLMVSAWKFIIITNTIKLQVCHRRRACRDDRKEPSFLPEQKDYSDGKLSCTSLPSGYDATVTRNSSKGNNPGNQLSGQKPGMPGSWEHQTGRNGKERRLVNRTSVWVFYWLYAHGEGTAWMDVYHRASKTKMDSLHGLCMRSMVKPQTHLDKWVKG